MDLSQILSQKFNSYDKLYAENPPFSNNTVFKLSKDLYKYEKSGNINETVKTQLELARILNKRVLELKNFFRENNIESAKDLDRPDTKTAAEEWLKSKGWWIPVRNDLDEVQDNVWRANIRNSYGELYNYLPDPQQLLNIAYNLNTKSMKKMIENSGIDSNKGEKVFKEWKKTNIRPIFNYPESERTKRAVAAESRRTSTGGKKRLTRKK